MTHSTIRFVPHRPPAVLCVAASLLDAQSAEGRLGASDGNALRRTDGRLDPLAGIEALAQLTASYLAFTIDDLAVKAGMLVALDHVQLPGPLPDGVAILRVRKTVALEEVTAFEGDISQADVSLLRAHLKIWTGRTLPEPPRHPSELAGPVASPLLAPPDDQLAVTMLGHLQKLSRTNGTAEGLFVFPESFPGFAGHFPGAPLLAGVLALKLGELMASLAADAPLRLAGVEKAKFTRPIRPGEPLLVAMTALPAAGLFRGVATVGGAPAAMFSLRMETAR